ncbi:MAG: hypothetical protein ACOYN3_10035 [Acidimicrobiia bacterium]
MDRPETMRQAVAGLYAWKLQLLNQNGGAFDRYWLPTIEDLEAAAAAGCTWNPHEWAAATGATCLEELYQIFSAMGYLPTTRAHDGVAR